MEWAKTNEMLQGKILLSSEPRNANTSCTTYYNMLIREDACKRKEQLISELELGTPFQPRLRTDMHQVEASANLSTESVGRVYLRTEIIKLKHQPIRACLSGSRISQRHLAQKMRAFCVVIQEVVFLLSVKEGKHKFLWQLRLEPQARRSLSGENSQSAALVNRPRKGCFESLERDG